MYVRYVGMHPINTAENHLPKRPERYVIKNYDPDEYQSIKEFWHIVAEAKKQIGNQSLLVITDSNREVAAEFRKKVHELALTKGVPLAHNGNISDFFLQRIPEFLNHGADGMEQLFEWQNIVGFIFDKTNPHILRWREEDRELFIRSFVEFIERLGSEMDYSRREEYRHKMNQLTFIIRFIYLDFQIYPEVMDYLFEKMSARIEQALDPTMLVNDVRSSLDLLTSNYFYNDHEMYAYLSGNDPHVLAKKTDFIKLVLQKLRDNLILFSSQEHEEAQSITGLLNELFTLWFSESSHEVFMSILRDEIHALQNYTEETNDPIAFALLQAIATPLKIQKNYSWIGFNNLKDRFRIYFGFDLASSFDFPDITYEEYHEQPWDILARFQIKQWERFFNENKLFIIEDFLNRANMSYEYFKSFILDPARSEENWNLGGFIETLRGVLNNYNFPDSLGLQSLNTRLGDLVKFQVINPDFHESLGGKSPGVPFEVDESLYFANWNNIKVIKEALDRLGKLGSLFRVYDSLKGAAKNSFENLLSQNLGYEKLRKLSYALDWFYIWIDENSSLDTLLDHISISRAIGIDDDLPETLRVEDMLTSLENISNFSSYLQSTKTDTEIHRKLANQLFDLYIESKMDIRDFQEKVLTFLIPFSVSKQSDRMTGYDERESRSINYQKVQKYYFFSDKILRLEDFHNPDNLSKIVELYYRDPEEIMKLLEKLENYIDVPYPDYRDMSSLSYEAVLQPTTKSRQEALKIYDEEWYTSFLSYIDSSKLPPQEYAFDSLANFESFVTGKEMMTYMLDLYVFFANELNQSSGGELFRDKFPNTIIPSIIRSSLVEAIRFPGIRMLVLGLIIHFISRHFEKDEQNEFIYQFYADPARFFMSKEANNHERAGTQKYTEIYSFLSDGDLYLPFYTLTHGRYKNLIEVFEAQGFKEFIELLNQKYGE